MSQCADCNLCSVVSVSDFPCNKCFMVGNKPMFSPKRVPEGARVFANCTALSDKTLRGGDYVQFKDILYKVQDEWLQNLSVGSNSKVWKAVGLYSDRHRIAKAFYGDDSDPDGDWPTYRIESHAEGLTKLVQWLLHQLEFPEYKSERRCLNCVYVEGTASTYPCNDCDFDKFLDARGFLPEDPDSEGIDEVDKEAHTVTCPRTFASSKELAGEVLRPGDVLYIQSVQYVVEGELGRWYLVRVTPDGGKNGLLFREFDLNAWALMYNIGLSQNSYNIHKLPSECLGWPEADTLENLTKFVHIVYALTTVYQVGHCKGQQLGREDYRVETERRIENAIKVLQQ